MVGLWLFSQTRLGPGPRQQGRQVQEPDSFPEGRAAVCPVCTSAARKIKVALARARDGVHQEGLVSALRGTRSACFWGLPTLYASNSGHGNDAAMQSMENDEAVSHPSPSRLEDACTARVSHIPTTTTTGALLKEVSGDCLHHVQWGEEKATNCCYGRREPYSA
jgi:hypothetical protein